MFLRLLQMEELAEIIRKFKTNITIVQEETVLLRIGYHPVAQEEIHIIEAQILHLDILHR